jgi:hypothetical protein
MDIFNYMIEIKNSTQQQRQTVHDLLIAKGERVFAETDFTSSNPSYNYFFKPADKKWCGTHYVRDSKPVISAGKYIQLLARRKLRRKNHDL